MNTHMHTDIHAESAHGQTDVQHTQYIQVHAQSGCMSTHTHTTHTHTHHTHTTHTHTTYTQTHTPHTTHTHTHTHKHIHTCPCVCTYALRSPRPSRDQ